MSGCGERATLVSKFRARDVARRPPESSGRYILAEHGRSGEVAVRNDCRHGCIKTLAVFTAMLVYNRTVVLQEVSKVL